MRRRLLLGVIGILLAIAVFFVVGGREEAGPTLTIGKKTIHLEIADTEEERTLGLGNREAIASDAGMLFLFREKDSYGVWMQDMRFPLDVVWLDEKMSTASETEANTEKELVVLDMIENVATSTYPEIFYPNAEASHVLELPAGSATKNGIQVGSFLIFRE